MKITVFITQASKNKHVVLQEQPFRHLAAPSITLNKLLFLEVFWNVAFLVALNV